MIGAILTSSALAADISEGWWAPGDPKPEAFGFAEGSKVLLDGRTAYRIHFIADPGSQILVSRADHRRLPPPTGYRLPDAGGAILAGIAADSSRAEHVVLGTSVDGRPIDGLWIGQPPGSGAPVYRVLGGHHGDEWSSFEVPLALAEVLAAGDGQDPEITALLDETTLWIAPYVNPDGIVEGSRYNANAVDLNRNYDYAWNPFEFLPGPYPFSEPETRAVQAMSHYNLPMAGLSFHAGATNIGYVWNHTLIPAPDWELALELGTLYAEQTANTEFWVTNGAAWYVTFGDTNDWSYGRYGVLDFTVEVTVEKAPPPSEIPDFVAGQIDATLALLSTRPTLSGRVVDAHSGRPVMAKITLDVTSSAFHSDPVGGDFHRITPPGPTEVTVVAPGYATTVLTTTSPQSDVLVQLERTEGVQRATWPVITEVSTLHFPEEWSGLISLHRPGTPSEVLLADSGFVVVDRGAMPRGAWTVQAGDQTWIRGLIMADDVLTSVSRDGSDLLLEGDFAAGSRVWALYGLDRALEPLVILEQSATVLRVDGSDLDEGQWTDVMVLSGGRHLAEANIFHTEERSVPIGDDIIIGVPVGCGCATGTGHRRLPLLSALMFFLIRRRSP